MKIAKSILKGVFWILILALLLAPLGLIYKISQQEMEEYRTPEAPIFRETSYGAALMATRTDVREYVTVTGIMVSNTYRFVELEQEYPDRIRWMVSSYDEIQEGQLLGYYQGTEILSPLTGILTEIHAYGSEPYLKVRMLEPLELECRVPQRVLNILMEGDELTTEDGSAARVLYAAKLKNDDGTTTIRLSVDGLKQSYGETVSELKLFTGICYPQALVLPEICLYQKDPGEDSQWYVREVTADGYFLREIPVNRGFTSGDQVCVTGIQEGSYFDAGYKSVVGGG